jgi:hypothetical protein
MKNRTIEDVWVLTDVTDSDVCEVFYTAEDAEEYCSDRYPGLDLLKVNDYEIYVMEDKNNAVAIIRNKAIWLPKG